MTKGTGFCPVPFVMLEYVSIIVDCFIVHRRQPRLRAIVYDELQHVYYMNYDILCFI